MDVSGTSSIAAQEIQTNKLQAGYDTLTKTLQKTEQNELNDEQRKDIALQTGKGMNIDIKA